MRCPGRQRQQQHESGAGGPQGAWAPMCVEMAERGCSETLCGMWLSGVKSSLGREGSVAQVLVME